MGLSNVLFVNVMVVREQGPQGSRLIFERLVGDGLLYLRCHSHHPKVGIRLLQIVRSDIPMQFVFQKF